MFLGCLTYTSDFIKDLTKLKKSLQQKLKKDVSWTWSTNDSKIIQNFKKMCKNLPVLNLLAMSTGVRYSKSKKEKKTL